MLIRSEQAFGLINEHPGCCLPRKDSSLVATSGVVDVSTVEDRLRELELQRRRRAELPAKIATRESQEAKRHVRLVAQEYLETAAALHGSVRPHIHHKLRCLATEQGFTIEVDGQPVLEADRESDAWRVTIWNATASVAQHTYDSDAALLDAKNELLGGLVTSTVQAVASVKQQPDDDRGRRTPWFNFTAFPWSGNLVTANAGRNATARRLKLAVYAIAFGGGLVLSSLLVKHSGHPPTPPREMHQRAYRHAVARSFPRAPHDYSGRTRSTSPARVVRPQASGAISPPPTSANGGAAPAAPRVVGQAGPKATLSGDAPALFFVLPASDAPTAGRINRQPAGLTLRFHVQVGVFNAREDAEALIQRLKSLGYAATLEKDEMYRAWVGGYFDRATAERLAANLSQAGFHAVLEP